HVAVVVGDPELLETVAALLAGGGLAHPADGGHEQADDDAEDRDHCEQVARRETAAAPGRPVVAGREKAPHDWAASGESGLDRSTQPAASRQPWALCSKRR